MRVLWFTNTPSMAGEELGPLSKSTGGWIESAEREMRKQKHVDLAVAFLSEVPIVKRIQVAEREYFHIPRPSVHGRINRFIQRQLHVIEPPSLVQSLLEVVDLFKPDIIHVFGTEGPFGEIASQVKVPVLIHVQGNLTVYAHKWFAGVSALEVLRRSKLGKLLRGHGNLHDYQTTLKKSRRERVIFSECKYFLGRTSWDKRITSVLSPNAHYYHCDELLREPFYHSRWRRKKSDSLTLITIMRNNLYKGLETVVSTALLLRELAGKRFVWKVVGLAENSEIVGFVDWKATKMTLEHNIEFLGSLHSQKLVAEMNASDIFVHPSHIDNSPNSVCEAMMLGMPIIATFAGGIPSIVKDGEEGLLVQDGDPYAMAGAILEMVRDIPLASRLGKRARQTAQKRHDRRRVIKEILSIYSQVLNNERRIRQTASN